MSAKAPPRAWRRLGGAVSKYIYIYIYMFDTSIHIYIYIYTYVADSPDQPQLKTQKYTIVACELNKTYPINRKNIGVT